MSSDSGRVNWRLILTVFTFLALTAIIYALRQQIFDTLTNLRRVNIWALPLMLLWQLFNYHSYSKLYQGTFSILGEKLRYRSLFRVMLELNFVNNVFPSGGVSGFSYFGVRMKDADVPVAKSTLTQLMRFIFIFVSFQVLLVLGLVALAAEGKANSLMLLVAGSVATLVAVGILLTIFIVGSKKRIDVFFTLITKLINKIISIVRPSRQEAINIQRARKVFGELHENYVLLQANISRLRAPFLWGLVANLSEVLTIYTVYIAFGEFVNPGAIILAYAVANFAGLVSVLPGGIGIYEAIMTAILVAAGIPAALSIPVTIMYRVLNMLIQLPPGYIAYHKALHLDRKKLT
ncbi:MAG: lysylphosphatidylglycerol synthase transmembrane domain-containing protein [Patescibacteria group bacterium]